MHGHVNADTVLPTTKLDRPPDLPWVIRLNAPLPESRASSFVVADDDLRCEPRSDRAKDRPTREAQPARSTLSAT